MNMLLLKEKYAYLHIIRGLFVKFGIFSAYTSTRGGDKCNTKPVGIIVK